MRLSARLFVLLHLILGMSSAHIASAQWTEEGKASYYADRFHGRRTASGELYDKDSMTAAHRTLPMGSLVRVTRKDSGNSIEVRVNDCGPHRHDRVIDLSKAAAFRIGLIQDGVAEVRLELLQPGEGHCACDRNKKWNTSEWAAPAPDTTPPKIIQVVYVETELATPGIQDTTAVQEPAKTAEEVPHSVPQDEQLPEDTSSSPEKRLGIALQAGAFGTRKNAERLAQLLKDQSFEKVFVRSFDLGERTIYRVYLGIFPGQEEALEAQMLLKEKMNIEGVVVELKS